MYCYLLPIVIHLQGNQSIQPTSQDNCDEVNETERATAIESETDISVPSNKRKAKSLNENPIKSVLKEKDNEPGQVKSSEGIQIKSKRGRTIAKVNYNEIYKQSQFRVLVLVCQFLVFFKCFVFIQLLHLAHKIHLNVPGTYIPAGNLLEFLAKFQTSSTS